MFGSCVVIAHRPTFPTGTTTASPTRSRRPIQASSACGSSPSTPKFMRNRRGSTASTPSTPAIAASEPSPSSVAAPSRPRSGAGDSGSTSRISSPANSDSASFHGPGTSRADLGSLWNEVTISSPGSIGPESLRPSGNASVSVRAASSYAARTVCSGPWRLSLTSRSLSSTRKNSRSPRSPDSSSVDRVDQVERKPLDRRQGDPRDACGHDYNVSCVL